MKLVVLGASGKTGVEIVKQALLLGYDVTALVRDNNIDIVDNKLSVITGDARSEETITKLIKDKDVVISALGSTSPNDELIVKFTQALINAASKINLKRVIVMSSFLASPNYIGEFMNDTMKTMINDKASGEQLLKQSNLDWSIVYPTLLDQTQPGSNIRIVKQDEKVDMNNGIARADVAKFLLSLINDPESIKKSFVITSK